MKFNVNVIKMKRWPYYKSKNYKAQKPKLIPKIKCTILLVQLYYIYYNIRPKNAQKGVIVLCFHPYGCLIKQIP